MTRWPGGWDFNQFFCFHTQLVWHTVFFPKGICWNTNWQHRFQRNVWPFALNKNSQATFSFCAVHFSMIPPFSSVVSCTAGVESVSSSAVWSRIWSGRLTDILRLRAEEVGKLLMIVDHLSHLAAILGPTWGGNYCNQLPTTLIWVSVVWICYIASAMNITSNGVKMSKSRYAMINMSMCV